MLEEAPRRTVLGMVGIEMSKNITIDRTDVTDEEIHQGFDSLFGGGNAKLYLNDAFGSTDLETVQSRIEHMVLSMGCRICDPRSRFDHGLRHCPRAKRADTYRLHCHFA